jgi:hypothetical protein
LQTNNFAGNQILNIQLNVIDALWANDSLNFLLLNFTHKYSKKYDVYKRGRRSDLVALGKRACAKDLLFEGEDRRLGLVVSEKRVFAEDLLFEGEDRCLGLVVSGKKGVRRGLVV